MGRPKGGKNIFHTKEEKLALVKRNLAGESLLSLERETGYIMHRYINGQSNIWKVAKLPL